MKTDQEIRPGDPNVRPTGGGPIGIVMVAALGFVILCFAALGAFYLGRVLWHLIRS